MPPRSRSLVRRLATAGLVVALAAAPASVAAQGGPASAGGSAARGATGSAQAVPAAWTRYVDAEHRFTLDVPPGTLVERSGNAWYVQLLNPDGGVGLPGMAIYREAGATIAEATANLVPNARTEEMPLGPGTTGVRIVATYETEAAGRYEATSYLAPFEGGVYRILPWEDLAWEPFERVARTFAFVEPIEAR